VLAVVQTRDDLVRFVGLDAVGVGRARAAREDGQQQDLRLREVFPQFQDVGANPLGNFRPAGASGVVGADHEHDRLGLVALPLAVLEAPQHALRRVARDAEVRDLHAGEILVHGGLAAGIAERVFLDVQQVGDRVADQHDIEVAAVCPLDQGIVPVAAGAARRPDARVVARDRDVNERRVLPE
jgi:hypothetical protein